MFEPGQLIGEKYVIEKLLGEGGMGAVFIARHTILGKKVAIKVLHPEFAGNTEVAERFVREAKAASLIGHENIIDVTDIGRTDGETLYLVMELLDGESLATRLRAAGRLPVAKAAEICGQVLLALRQAHAKGIIHRDIKPENIFLTKIAGRRDFVKILDFGISKFNPVVTSVPDSLHLTKTGSVLGTPYYMAPEQARGEAVDHRIDIYSTGVILYEMVTGALPYEGANAQAVIFKIGIGEMIPPRTRFPEIPAGLEELILKSMANDREQRFYSAAEFFARLKPFGAKDYAALEGQAAGEISSDAADGAAGAKEGESEAGAEKAPHPPSEPVSGGSHPEDAAREAGTLSGTAHQIVPDATTENKERHPSYPILAGVAAVALILAVAGALLVPRFIGHDKRVSSPESIPIDRPSVKAAAGPSSGQKAGPFSLRVGAQPAAARIKVDGKPVDGNPAEIDVAGAVDHVVSVEADGFVSQEKHVSLSGDREISFNLLPTKASSPKGTKAKAAKAAPPQPSPAGDASPAPSSSKAQGKKKAITDTWDDFVGKEGTGSVSRPRK